MRLDTLLSMGLLRSRKLAWVVGFVLVPGIALLAYSYVGWLGVGAIGVAGLFISQQMELHGNTAISVNDDVTIYVSTLVQRQKLQDSMPPEQKLAFHARERDRRQTRYLMNTCWTSLTALGFSMLIIH
jgi:hypothetical protein